jgi:hypothetical protein
VMKIEPEATVEFEHGKRSGLRLVLRQRGSRKEKRRQAKAKKDDGVGGRQKSAHAMK